MAFGWQRFEVLLIHSSKSLVGWVVTAAVGTALGIGEGSLEGWADTDGTALGIDDGSWLGPTEGRKEA